MLKQKTRLFIAVILFTSVAFVSCNNDADKKSETTIVTDTTKMQTTTEQKMEPAKPDSMVKGMDTTMGSTKPVVPTK